MSTSAGMPCRIKQELMIETRTICRSKSKAVVGKYRRHRTTSGRALRTSSCAPAFVHVMWDGNVTLTRVRRAYLEVQLPNGVWANAVDVEFPTNLRTPHD